jgi:hypothetical protein
LRNCVIETLGLVRVTVLQITQLPNFPITQLFPVPPW